MCIAKRICRSIDMLAMAAGYLFPSNFFVFAAKGGWMTFVTWTVSYFPTILECTAVLVNRIRPFLGLRPLYAF